MARPCDGPKIQAVSMKGFFMFKTGEYHRMSIQAKRLSRKVKKLLCRSQAVYEVSRIYCHSLLKVSCHRPTSCLAQVLVKPVFSSSSPACAFPGPQRHLRRWKISLGIASCRGAQRAQARGPAAVGQAAGAWLCWAAGRQPGPCRGLLLLDTSPDPGRGLGPNFRNQSLKFGTYFSSWLCGLIIAWG